jgi:hypothetical protein
VTLWKIFTALLIVWLVLLVSRHVFGGYAHILFVAAVVLGLIQILWRRRAI